MSDDTNEGKPNDIEAMQRALTKANEEAARYRHEAKEAKEVAEAASPYRDKYMQSRVENMLLARGVKNPERLVGLVDVSDAKEDADLETKVDALTESLPEVFDPKARAGSIDAADKGGSTQTKTATEQLAARLLNRNA